MTYYIQIKNNEIITGATECRVNGKGLENIEITKIQYDTYNSNPEMYIWDGVNIIIDPDYEQKQAQKERERIDSLSLTRGDVFRALLWAKQVTRAMIKAQLDAMSETTPEEMIAKESAMIDFDEAQNFFRGNELINTVGATLGITAEQLDNFFIKGNDEVTKAEAWKYLTNVTVAINPTPETAIVKINDIESLELTVPYGSDVTYEVSAEDYVTTLGEILEIVEDAVIDIELVAEPSGVK